MFLHNLPDFLDQYGRDFKPLLSPVVDLDVVCDLTDMDQGRVSDMVLFEHTLET